MDFQNTSKTKLIGTINSQPKHDHDVKNIKMFSFSLATTRLSKTQDVLNIICPENVLKDKNLSTGDRVEINGRIRTMKAPDKNDPEKMHLVIEVIAKTIDKVEDPSVEDNDIVTVRGTVCSKKPSRKTPLNRTLAEMMVAVDHFGTSSYIPTILWGSLAQKVNESVKVGTKVELTGRLQSRKYNKTLPDGSNEERVAYEFSANTLEIYDPNTADKEVTQSAT